MSGLSGVGRLAQHRGSRGLRLLEVGIDIVDKHGEAVPEVRIGHRATWAHPGLSAPVGWHTCPVSTVIIPELSFPLAADGSPPCEYRVENGALILTGAARTDMFVDPSGDGPTLDAGRLIGVPPDGAFSLAAKVTVHFASKYDAGALLIYAGHRSWAKLCFELSPQLTPTAVTVVTRHSSDDCNSFEVAGQELWLRVTRSGRAWAFHASTDNRWLRLLRYFALSEVPADVAGPVRLGFLAQSPTASG